VKFVDLILAWTINFTLIPKTYFEKKNLKIVLARYILAHPKKMDPTTIEKFWAYITPKQGNCFLYSP